MQPKGYREVLVSPHLAYRNVGISGLIPPDAMLRMQLWEQDIKSHVIDLGGVEGTRRS